jgi:hypothetical protein
LTLQLLYIAPKFINLKLIRTRTFTNLHMKRNIAIGIFLISALTLGSCSTQKLTTTATNDDVYFSNAKAGDEPIYAAQPVYNQGDADYQQAQQQEDDDDYFYYDDYASRINRFSYYSPFGFYNNLYYGYSNPYYSNGFAFDFNYGPFGYGYNPYGYGYGYGFGLGYGYGGWGLGYGYGGYGYGGYGGYGYGGYGGYGGNYGYVTVGTPRPVRGTGNPLSPRGTASPFSRPASTTQFNNNGTRRRDASNVANGIGYIPGYRGTRNADGVVTRGNSNNSNTSYSRDSRPTRQQDSRPTIQTVDRSSSQPAPSSNSGSRSSGGGSSSGGGGGGRPVRP